MSEFLTWYLFWRLYSFTERFGCILANLPLSDQQVCEEGMQMHQHLLHEKKKQFSKLKSTYSFLWANLLINLGNIKKIIVKFLRSKFMAKKKNQFVVNLMFFWENQRSFKACELVSWLDIFAKRRIRVEIWHILVAFTRKLTCLQPASPNPYQNISSLKTFWFFLDALASLRPILEIH